MQGLVRGWTKHLTPPVPGWQRTDPLDRGLVGEWRFDENTGLMLPDYSGRGHHGAISGATWTVTERGSGLDFNAAANDVVNCGVFNSANITVELYMTPDLVTPTRDVAAKRKAGLESWAFEMGNVLTGFWIHDGGWRGGYKKALQAGQWYHCVGTYDGATVIIYIDGVNEGETVWAGAIDSTASNVTFGGDDEGGRSFDGVIDQVRIYNRALTAAEISARYQICLKRAQPLTHVWMTPWGMAPVAPPVGGHMTLWGRYWGP